MKAKIFTYNMVTEKFNLSELDKEVSAHWIFSQEGSNGLRLFDYSKSTQFNNYWTDLTLQTRGLILNADGTVHSRCYPKFFNLEELDEVDFSKHGKAKIFDKLDGSMGILYWDGNTPKISTRGSFNSDQAIEGTKILKEKYSDIWSKIDKTKTYIFEILYKENRVVCDYGDLRDIILTAIIDTKTGKTLDFSFNPGFSQVKEYEFTDWTKVRELFSKPNQEGWVILFESGLRLKIKQADYILLHKKLTKISSRDLWDMFSAGLSLEAVLDDMPDESWDWIRKWENIFTTSLEARKKEIFDFIDKTDAELKDLESKGVILNKKRIWDLVKSNKNAHLYLAVKSGKNIDDKLWKELYPKRELCYN
jgi:RNA ligase